MTVRQKTLIAISMTSIALVVVLYISASMILLRGFDSVEKQKAREGMERVMDTIGNRMKRLDSQVWDWAAWDETYDFIRNGTPRYLDNMVDSGVATLQVNTILYFNPSGELVHGIGFDMPRGRKAPVPRGLLEVIKADPAYWLQKSMSSKRNGVVILPDGPMLLAARPIVNSAKTLPVRGTLVFGRFLDTDELRDFERLTRLHLYVGTFRNGRLSRDCLVAAADAQNPDDMPIRVLDNDQVAAYRVVRDYRGDPGFIVRSSNDRDVYREGQRTLRYLLIALPLCGIAFLCVTSLLLERLVLRRLTRLSGDVNEIRRSVGASLRLTATGSDEISQLQGHINRMLDALESAHEDIKESESLYRLMASNASDLLYSMEIPFGGMTWYGGIDEALGYTPGEFPDTYLGFETAVHPDDLESVHEAVYRTLETGESLDMEYRVLCKDGSVRYWWDRWCAVTDTDGRIVRLLGACTDVTERRRSEDRLRVSEERLSKIVETSANAIFIVDLEGRITFANASAERLVGMSRQDITRRLYNDPAWKLSSLEGQPDMSVNEVWYRVTSRGEYVYNVEHTVERCDGKRLIVSTNAAPLRDKNDLVIGAVISVSDITERRALQERLSYQAFHDPLTGLPNRALFLDRLTKALARSRRTGKRLALLFLDLDNFKNINDSLGHAIGDQFLVDVAHRLQRALRESDTAARFGGDEFTIIAEDVGDAAGAQKVAERIMQTIQMPLALGGRDLYIGCSIGIAMGTAAENAGDLLRNADAAMYEAKSRGKGCVEIYQDCMNTHAVRRLQLENDLRRALDLGELVVYYQPKVDLSTTRFVGVEALVRWQHPKLGLIKPADFIPLAEETGLIIQIGRWVLSEACRQAAVWQKSWTLTAPLLMSVNLSARQFNQAGLAEDVAGILQETGLPPESLALEITESVMMGDADQTLRTLHQLKSLGVRLVIDDFGTGYSSFSYLRRFPVDYLKIDRSFVAGLTKDKDDSVIVSATISLAHALGLTVIAEGAETLEQADELRRLGCDMAQGFCFSHPVDGREVSLLLGLPDGLPGLPAENPV